MYVHDMLFESSDFDFGLCDLLIGLICLGLSFVQSMDLELEVETLLQFYLTHLIVMLL